MDEPILLAKLPALPAPDFFACAENSIMTADGSAILSYDPSTCSGFVYYIADRVWTISAPIDFVTFALQARLAGHAIDEGEATRRWLAACFPSRGTAH